MREIKFRAWDRYNKKMLYDVQNTYDYMRNEVMEDCFGDVLEHENYIVMEYTGLKDKNGKEIYEGDVLSNNCCDKKCEYHIQGFVVFKEGRFEMNDGYTINSLWEIIANIYENEEYDYLKEEYNESINN